MKKEELRIGNTIYYETEHGDLITHTVDIDSLIWLSEDEKGFNLVHTPITLTEELIIKLGGEIEILYQNEPLEAHRLKFGRIQGFNLFYNHISDITPLGPYNVPVKYLHEFQNLYYTLKNQELEINL